MKIGLIGGSGAIGRRYQAILKFFGESFEIIDPVSTKITETEQLFELADSCDQWIICSPTRSHDDWILEAKNQGKRFLVEKPAVFYPESLRSLAGCEGYVVNNWDFLFELEQCPKNINQIYWDYFSQGSEDVLRNMAQLISIADIYSAHLIVKSVSPVWTCQWNAWMVPYAEIEKTYVKMIDAFLRNDTKKLRDLNYASRQVLLIEKLKSYMGEKNVKNFNWDPSTNEFLAIS